MHESNQTNQAESLELKHPIHVKTDPCLIGRPNLMHNPHWQNNRIYWSQKNWHPGKISDIVFQKENHSDNSASWSTVSYQSHFCCWNTSCIFWRVHSVLMNVFWCCSSNWYRSKTMKQRCFCQFFLWMLQSSDRFQNQTKIVSIIPRHSYPVQTNHCIRWNSIRLELRILQSIAWYKGLYTIRQWKQHCWSLLPLHLK